MSAQGVSAQEGCVCPGRSLPGGVCPGVFARGECLLGGVCPGGVCLGGCLPRGVSAQGVLLGGFCPGGCIPACTEADTPTLWTEFLTHASENITLPQLHCRW